MDNIFEALIRCMMDVHNDGDNSVYTLYWVAPDIGNFAITVRRPSDEEEVEHFKSRPKDATVH